MEDSTDTHFCLNCHKTIVGLDAYVKHRQSGVCKPKSTKISNEPQSIKESSEMNLKADDFFSSLELQSSSKRGGRTSSSGKNVCGILTRSKTSAVSIKGSSAALTVTSTSPKEPVENQSRSGKNVWIGGQHLKLGSGDNQDKLSKALAHLERRKDEVSTSTAVFTTDFEDEFLNASEYDDTSSDDDDVPPRTHTGGKWKPTMPVDWHNSPPSGHTGGKWKPKPPPITHTKGKWKPTTYSPERQDVPSSSSGGKWGQSKVSQQKKTVPREKIDPSYTKGKWLPHQIKITEDPLLRKSSGSVQYWCRPCSRRLTSKVVYNRHLKSKFHLRRTLIDREFEENDVHTEEVLKSTPSSGKLSHLGKRTDTTKKRRIRKQIYIRCEVCKSRVVLNRMGKHMISHYHWRKSNLQSPVAGQMVLDNIQAIVLQSPFQCSICRYYFNDHSHFIDHWLSEEHETIAQRISGYFWCNFCAVKCDTSRDMYKHLISIMHREVLAAINRSVPIIIRKVNPFKCLDCYEEFTYKFALIQHCKRHEHTLPQLGQSDYNDFVCNLCYQMFKSNIALKNHNQQIHGITSYICTPCDMTFGSFEDAQVHRRSAEHHGILNCKKLGKPKERDCKHCGLRCPSLAEMKTHLLEKHLELCPRCVMCNQSFAVPQDLTVHSRMQKCQLSKEKETKDGSKYECDQCNFMTTSEATSLFHQALHNPPLILDTTVDKKVKPVNKPKTMQYYKCPVCERFFTKASLHPHLRLHTNERVYTCRICQKGFVRENNCLFHERQHTNPKLDKKPKEHSTKINVNRLFLCQICGASFTRKFILQQHMIVHQGKLFKCPNDDCLYAGRTRYELNLHIKSHSEQKSFSCDECDYKGKTKYHLKRHMIVHTNKSKVHKCSKCAFSTRTMSHLRRHVRIHTGAKPFWCPHCDYRCASLDNLRKHVLRTKIHSGKCIYECKFCSYDVSQFQTNSASAYRVHLVKQHSDCFSNKDDVLTYVAGIYTGQEDAVEEEQESIEHNENLIFVNDTAEGPELEENSGQQRVFVIQNSSPSTSSTGGLISVPTKDPCTSSSSGKDVVQIEDEVNRDENFPLYLVSKEDDGFSVSNLPGTWALIESYNAEDNTFVSFSEDSNDIVLT